MKYKVELTEEQLRIIHNALEEYFRVRMGQFQSFADNMAFLGFSYKNHSKEEFDRRVIDRDWLMDFLEFWKRKSTSGMHLSKSKEVENTIDMWHVIEHQQWLDNPNNGDWDRASSKPFPSGDEPLIRIERIEDQINGIPDYKRLYEELKQEHLELIRTIKDRAYTWIPSDEELPDDSGISQILACKRDGEINIVTGSTVCNSRKIYIAWMPLPEDYEGVEYEDY